MSVILVNERKGNEREFESVEEAEEQKQQLIGLGMKPENLEIKTNGEAPAEDAPISQTSAEQEQKQQDELAKQQAAEVVEDTDETPQPAEPVEPEELSKNPIGFLRSVNDDFVNTIKGKPAISKQGFRFIQREFEISTRSEVVQWSDDPVGCVVWAKAELPSGYSAEAHGEGYQFEKDVSDNEFVRYADTRAKNRAISDLTSAGALAVSELQPDK